MLSFRSASTRIVNSRRAIQECVEAAFEDHHPHCDVLLIHASIGHDFGKLAAEARKQLPGARILGSSCCGVVGTEGVSESMKDVAIMAITGQEHLAVAHTPDTFGHNSFARGAELGRQLRRAQPGIRMVYFLASGIDIDNDACIAGLESVLGTHVTIFGATSADNMRGVTSYQIIDDEVCEHAAFAIGFADPDLDVVTEATHGFLAVGEPMVVTAATANRIHTLNHRPAWEVFTERLGLPASSTCADTIPIGALAEALSPAAAKEYGNPHILRAVTKRDEDGTMHYPTTIPVGTKLWLTIRDEQRIFSDMDRAMGRMRHRIGDDPVLAVFHADCLARGRVLFDRVMKEELVSCMQYPLAADGVVPPWLGMYGFGEFARLAGENRFHNYTTALYAVVRRSGPFQKQG